MLFVAMVSSQLMFSVTILLLKLSGDIPAPEELDTMWIYLLIASASIGLISSNFVVNGLIMRARSKATLAEKLRAYQTASLIRYALLEVPSMIGIVGFYLTGMYWFFTFTAVALAFFLLVIPSRAKVCEVLQLSHDEITLLNDPKAVVMEYESTSD